MLDWIGAFVVESNFGVQVFPVLKFITLASRGWTLKGAGAISSSRVLQFMKLWISYEILT